MLRFALVFFSSVIFSTLAADSEWSYDGSKGPGPNNWGQVCGIGKSQSPIDVPTHKLKKQFYNPFIFHGYDKEITSAKIVNNGHTIQLNPGEVAEHLMPTVIGGGLPGQYKFAQFHFHWGSDNSKGSEHTVDRKAYPLELHLVHYRSEYGSNIGEALATKRSDALAVLGIFFEVKNGENLMMDDLLDTLNKIKANGDESEVKNFKLEKYLPKNTERFYRYMGGLTTPGCFEQVVWTVFKTPVGISARQLEKFRQLSEDTNSSGKKIVNNFRPVMPLHGRIVSDVETIDVSTDRFLKEKAKSNEICQHSGSPNMPVLTMVSVVIFSLFSKLL